MPNHVTNTVKADNWEILKEKLVRQAKAGEDNHNDLVIDFNLLIPQPESLNITSGGTQWETGSRVIKELQMRKEKQDSIIKPVLDKIYKKGMSIEDFLTASRTTKNDIKFREVYEISASLPIETVNERIENVLKGYYNLRTYDYIDWYSWRLDKWGTKWNAYHDYVNEYNQTLSFDTAWSCPFEIFDELSKYTPVTVMYADEDTGHNYGIIRFENGKRTIILDDTNKSIGESYACKENDLESLEFDFSEDNYSDEEIEEYFNTDRKTFFLKAKNDYNNTLKLIEQVM